MYMYMYIYKDINIYIYIYVYTCLYIHLFVYIYVCMYTPCSILTLVTSAQGGQYADQTLLYEEGIGY